MLLLATVATLALVMLRREDLPAAIRASETITLRISVSSVGTLSYSLARSLSARLAALGGHLALQVVESKGPLQNVLAVQRGDAEIGLGTSDIVYDNASRIGETGKSLRGMAVLNNNPIHVVVPVHSKVRTLRDLAGKRLAVGTREGGSAPTVEYLLASSGLKPSDVHMDTVHLRYSAERLRRGEVDAIIIAASFPYEPVKEAMRTGGRLLSVDGGTVARALNRFPFYRPVAVPANTYSNQPQRIHTVAVDTVMFCREDLSAQTVKTFLKLFFKELGSLDSPLVSRINVAEADATPIPLHSGAAAYYRERALQR